MAAENSSWVNRLILLLLTFNLGCMVLLLVQQNRQNRTQPAPALGQVSIQDTSFSEATERPTYLPVTNRAIIRPRVADPDSRRGLSAASRSGPEMAMAPEIAAVQPAPTPNERSASSGWLAGSAIAAQAGHAFVSGRVWLSGAPPPETIIPLSGACAEAHPAPLSTRHYVVTEDGRLANVLVYIKSGLENRKFLAPTNRALLQLSGCAFEPYVMGVLAGQKVRLKNLDPIMHNFHATPRVNHELNSALIAGQTTEFSFARAEIVPPVRLKCDVHPWEFAYVAVLPHPFFAVTDTEGEFQLPLLLPPGKYEIAAFHLKAGETVQQIEVRKGETKYLDFTLSVPTAAN
jgi:hypothetical protein